MEQKNAAQTPTIIQALDHIGAIVYMCLKGVVKIFNSCQGADFRCLIYTGSSLLDKGKTQHLLQTQQDTKNNFYGGCENIMTKICWHTLVHTTIDAVTQSFKDSSSKLIVWLMSYTLARPHFTGLIQKKPKHGSVH